MVATIKRWQGLTTDDKPSSDVPEGSTFHCIDTGEQYIYHQDMWEKDLRLVNAIKEADLAALI